MTLTQKLLGCAAGLALGLGVASGANAAIYTEIGDASAIFGGGANPQAVGAGINQINGSISSNDEGDLFKVIFSVGGTLTITGNATSGSLDPNMFLFSVTGAGIRVDDDSGSGANAQIVASIAAGTYYIGIGDYPMQAVDTDGSQWNGGLATNDTPPGSFGILSYIRNTSGIATGNYSILLSISTGEASGVPEPMTLGLLGAGLIGLGAAARRRRQS